VVDGRGVSCFRAKGVLEKKVDLQRIAQLKANHEDHCHPCHLSFRFQLMLIMINPTLGKDAIRGCG
jgi:hypothetical protein